MIELSPTVFNLQERCGPTLSLGQSALGESSGGSGALFFACVTCVLAILAALVLVPLSLEVSGSSLSGRFDLFGLAKILQQKLPSERAEETGKPARGDVPAVSSSAQSSVDPFTTPLLAPLKGQYCSTICLLAITWRQGRPLRR